MNIFKEKARQELDRKLPLLPWYVEKYMDYKRADLSPTTLLEYARDYETFFGWMLAEGLTEASRPSEITLSDLEALRLENIDLYKAFLAGKRDRTNAKATIVRKLSSLRSLFHYLSQIAEDENYYPLLRRNVMAKIELKRTSKVRDMANKLEGKLLQEDEIASFIAYIREGYGHDVEGNKQALHAYRLNRERDASIISLILHSGLRVSEVVNLTVDDVDLDRKLVYVHRKGTREEAFKTGVYFRQEAKEDLLRYLAIRDDGYRPPRREKALFLAVPNGQREGKRMTRRAIQEMVTKYAKRFGKPHLRVHRLRHSFATDYYLQNDLYKTQEQLGHASPETTQLYAHLTDKTMSRAIDNRRE
ncbi:tyrosine recombinase XerS [Paenibacillus sp. J31TS4]|uniref:tyrosine recombinase XerS n=1 Tax=Paenibacillus sp. J31TS4 TaxID=2807195 RepID=UPI001B0D6702|nr:tyrosine recombinase XerS [Paenibacillus sp. J31TS4]GIP37190.1 tyrosine recombinase XerS [Paenibacillus sp. J31TS4]